MMIGVNFLSSYRSWKLVLSPISSQLEYRDSKSKRIGGMLSFRYQLRRGQLESERPWKRIWAFLCWVLIWVDFHSTALPLHWWGHQRSRLAIPCCSNVVQMTSLLMEGSRTRMRTQNFGSFLDQWPVDFKFNRDDIISHIIWELLVFRQWIEN